MPRYHFNEFVLSPRRRLLLRGGSEQPLIPRYFDLLVFLVEHRHEAVHRRDIFDRVWREVTVSDSALSQAIRTIRRVLDDNPRDPRFIRTVSRHGYRFVFTGVREEQEDGGAWPPGLSEAAAGADAASTLRTASQSVAAGTSPSVIQPEPRGALAHPAPPPSNARANGRSRAASGGAIAGVAAGGLGGLILAAAPNSSAPLAIAPVLAVIGGGCGALGGAGVGAGLALAEPLASGTIHAIAVAADRSRATLAPLAQLIGEPDFGRVSAGILAFGEAAIFGAGLTLGLLRRRSASDAPLR